MDLKTFKDKFTNKIEPFDFKRVIKKKRWKLCLAGTFPGVYFNSRFPLPRRLLQTLQELKGAHSFSPLPTPPIPSFPTHPKRKKNTAVVSVRATQRSKMFPNSSRKALRHQPRLSVLPHRCNPIQKKKTAGNSHA